MTLWFVFALMTAAAIFAVLWPLGRATAGKAGGSESAVYKDQLVEIGRDAAAGLIAAPEAEAARVEIGRRLLAATDAEQDVPAKASPRFRRAVAVLALVGLPALAMAFYLPLGSPRFPDFPLAERARAPSASDPMDNLVAQVQKHLEQNPTDGRGWNVLAPVLAKLGRFDDAVVAFRNAITYGGDTAARRADLGEAIAAAANGVITADAKAEFDRAVALDANEAKARFFLGLAAEQDGRMADAAAVWRDMLAKAPADAPWRSVVQAALARVGGPALPALSDDTIAAAQGMGAGDRNAMVQSMVDRLATRLKNDGNDVEGWLRLVRAYMVLGDRDKAKQAVADARQAVGSDSERLRQLNDGLKSAGLDG
ncbi:c-type cytochrome biogenesis protein CcmI [Rhodopseudomonas sp. RCAM05734]|uniref:c-type cytochrome biogenesis protein CcmI n=1 Tax=Rhodopseudomonas sp. RCAM05734 TaxID=3457549 RepID=UPI004043D13B